MKELDITQAKARTIAKKLCKDLDIPLCKIWFIAIDDEETLGWYSSKRCNMFAYIIIEKKWSRRLILVLHELAHHVQEELYDYSYPDETPHGKSFSLSKSRVATWAKNNISDYWDWESMLTKYSLGKRNGR